MLHYPHLKTLGMAEQPRVAAVTGTNSGVGLSFSVLLEKDGFQVFAGMRGVSSEKRAPLDAAVAEAGADTTPVEAIELDVNSDESVTQAIEAILQKTGRVDVSRQQRRVLRLWLL